MPTRIGDADPAHNTKETSPTRAVPAKTAAERLRPRMSVIKPLRASTTPPSESSDDFFLFSSKAFLSDSGSR